MKTTFQKIPLFMSALIFLACSFAFAFLYREINNNNKKAEEGKAVLQMEAERRNSIRTLDQTLQRIAPERADLDTHFAKSSDVVPFLDTIEKLAPSVGAKAEVTSVDALPGNTGLVVGLKASGDFSSLYEFLGLLENSPYELDFLGVDMRKTEAADKKSSGWEAVFKVQLLSFVP